jgi:tetratricopeptide (TPR) repeat protein
MLIIYKFNRLCPDSLRLRTVALLLVSALVLSGCGSPEEKEARYLKHGNQLFDEGKYDKARVDYRNALRLKPADPEVFYRMALVDEAVGNLRDAYNNFTKAVQQNAQYYPAILKLAEYYTVAGQYDEAQQRISFVLQNNADNADAHGMQGALDFRQKNLTGAKTEAKTALGKDPDNVIALSVLATIYNAEGDQAKAIETVEGGLTKNPKNLSLLLLEANLYDKSKDLKHIDDIYQRIFLVSPKEAKYRVRLAVIHANANDIDGAEKILRDGIAALPEDWDLRHQLAQFLSTYRGIEAADKELHALITAFPDRPEPYAWLVDLYLSHNALDQAQSFLTSALKNPPSKKQEMSLKAALARVDYAKGDEVAAQRYADETLADDPNNLDALFIRARLEAENGAYQNAIADLRTIIRDRPKATQAQSVLSEIFVHQGHVDLGIETLNQLIETDPLDLPSRVRLAQLYDINGNSAHAMDILFNVTKTNPKLALAWQTTAQIAIGMKDYDTAEAAITKLDALENQHYLATFIRGQLAVRHGTTSDAIQDFETVIDANPSPVLTAQALTSLIGVYQKNNNLKDAITYLTSLKLQTPLVFTLLGECYVATGQPGPAATAYEAAIALHPRAPEPYLGRARLYIAERNMAKAIEMLDLAIAALPGDQRAAVMKGEVLEKAGDYKGATQLYEKVLDNHPELDLVANNLAEVIADYQFKDSGALEKARQIAERFAISPNPLFLDTLAWVYYRQGHTDQAQALMDKAVTLSAKLPAQFHYHYGAILLANNDLAHARSELLQATAKYYDYPGFEDAKTLLARIK